MAKKVNANRAEKCRKAFLRSVERNGRWRGKKITLAQALSAEGKKKIVQAVKPRIYRKKNKTKR